MNLLFRPFMQADASTTRRFGGTGLGLVLTKRLAGALNGDFVLKESRLGKGSTFEVPIPVEIVQGTKSVGTSELSFSSVVVPKPAARLPKLNGMRVLVVEDSPDNRALLKILLAKAGAETEFLFSSKEFSLHSSFGFFQ